MVVVIEVDIDSSEVEPESPRRLAEVLRSVAELTPIAENVRVRIEE